MKRSDMIEQLANLLEEAFDGNNGNWTLDAEKALNFLESQGMLPPGVPCGSYSYKNEWEPETEWGDDEKI